METVRHAINGVVYDWAVDDENVFLARQFLLAVGKNPDLLTPSETVALAVSLKNRYAMNALSSPYLGIEPIGGFRQ